MNTKTKIIISCILLVVLCLAIGITSNNLKKRKEIQKSEEEQRKIQNNLRYEEIRNDVNKEMERYHYVMFPTCNPNVTAVQRTTDKDLIYDAGMNKDKFLDVDGENYCDTLTYATCIEKNKWDFKTYLRCRNHTDNGFIAGDYY